MDTNERIQQLKNLAALQRKIVQDQMVSVMFDSGRRANKPFEKLTTWLLAGTGASASLLIGNADKVVPILTKPGFLTIGILLCISAIFGIVSKYFAVLYDLGRALSDDIQQKFPDLLDQYSKQQEKLNEYAEPLGITIDTEVKMPEVMEKFLSPMPWWVKWKIRRDQTKTTDPIHENNFKQVRLLNSQLTSATIQIFIAIMAMGCAFIFASVV